MSHQKTLTFETCHDASSKEANNPQLLMGVSTTIDGSKTDPVDKLTRLRKEESVGKSNKHHVSHTDSGEENEKAQNKHISKGRMKAIKAKRREKALRGSQEN